MNAKNISLLTIALALLATTDTVNVNAFAQDYNVPEQTVRELIIELANAKNAAENDMLK